MNMGDDWLAASPDGVVDKFVYHLPSRGVLEIKCPFFNGDMTKATPWKRIPIYYVPQAQGLMEILDQDWMDYYVWTTKGSSLFRLHRDEEYWQLLKTALSDFWWKNVQPAKELCKRSNIRNPFVELASHKPEPKHEVFRQSGSSCWGRVGTNSYGEGLKWNRWISLEGRCFASQRFSSSSMFSFIAAMSATMTKIIKEMLPPDVRVARDAQDLLIECCVEFINLISSASNEVCNRVDKRTIAPEHVLKALEVLGFGEYIEEVYAAYEQHKLETVDTESWEVEQ
ncbi:hypothetical protein K7X08_034764 [Anisodus acutangulus]|uniref:Transcription factor CBF/NF-Y/archaeal histone domain-containing protein n=1 Tax=Anisodus acutangulus TaxID=402998 RepID=A0A9Q1LJQ4_9SOLA|nr:hypothetical protein K7X08_034764 [Anisodus acutangulus]